MSFCFFDWETRSALDLTVTGTLKYVLDPSTQPLLASWAIDDDPVKLWCPEFSKALVPEVWAYVKGRMAVVGPAPQEIVKLLAQPDGYVVAHNAGFDRAVWQQVATPDFGWPALPLERVLDNQSQAQASNLPGSLDFAGRALGLGTKTIGGKAIMKRFADAAQPLPGSPAGVSLLMEKGYSRERAIAEAIEAWALYLDYSVQDTELMRDVWKCTRPLSIEEWREYHDSERINDRGMPVDLDIARGAIQYRAEEAAYVAERLAELTNGQITSPTLTKQINEWVFDRLPDDLAENMVKERDDEGYVTRLTGAKNVITQLIEDIETSESDIDDLVLDVLELLQFGRSSSAVKFEKIAEQAVDDRLYGSFVFNGAGQTGRASSRGPQLHNAVHKFMPNELDVLDMIAARVPIDQLRHLPLGDKIEEVKRAKEGKTSVSTILARSVRPTFVAPKGRTFVWGDWSAIEARVMPWLANSRAAEQTVLDAYRRKEDIYILNAAAIFSQPLERIVSGLADGDPIFIDMRQAGKISQLSLQFAGSVGAYKAMARGYDVRVTNEEARMIVDGWRDRNKWAKAYWNVCDEASESAMQRPGSMQKAGRLTFCFYTELMGGSLVTFLPCGRPLVYPKARYSKIERFGKEVWALTYLNGMGRGVTYGGKLGQNGCQAAAASLLRSTMSRLEDGYAAGELDGMIIGHTHDEIVNEVDEDRAEGFAEQLLDAMVTGFDWTEGLPLKADITSSYYYTKSKH